MRCTEIDKIFYEINDFIKFSLLLVVLGMVIQVTGAKFFGVNLFPIIVSMIIIAILISELANNKRTINWINQKLNKLFR